MTAFPYHGLGSKRRLVSGCAFGFQHFHHLVGGGGGSVLFEIAGNHKDGVPPAYLGHAIRAAGGGGGAFLGRVGHRQISFPFSSFLRRSIFSRALAFLKFSPVMRTGQHISPVWASLNTFSAASGDFAKVAAIFLPLIPTKLHKAKWTLICGNFPLFLTKPHNYDSFSVLIL